MAKFDQFAGRLRLSIGKDNPTAFARKCGIGESLMRNYLAGKTLPGTEYLVLLAEKAGVAIDWLATGRGPMRPEEHPGPEVGLGDVAQIPLCSTAPSAGHGAFCEGDHIEGWLPIPMAMVHHLGVPPKSLCALRVSGTSMEPMLRDGEILFADRRHDRVTGDGIYIFRMDHVILVKRLQVLPGGSIQVIAENPAFPNFTVSASTPPTDFQILARVVGNFRKA